MTAVSELADGTTFYNISPLDLTKEAVVMGWNAISTPFAACSRCCSARSALKSRVDQVTLGVPHRDLLRLKAVAETLTTSNQISKFDSNKLKALLTGTLANEKGVFKKKLSLEEHELLLEVSQWVDRLSFTEDSCSLTLTDIQRMQRFNDMLEGPYHAQVGIVHAATNRLVHLAYNDKPLPMVEDAIRFATELQNKHISADVARVLVKTFVDQSKLAVLVYNVQKAFPASTDITRELDIVEEQFEELKTNPKHSSTKLLDSLNRIHRAHEGLVPRLREDIDDTREASLDSVKKTVWGFIPLPEFLTRALTS